MKRIEEIRIEFEEEMEMEHLRWILPTGLAVVVLSTEYNTFLCFFDFSLLPCLFFLTTSFFSSFC